MTQQCFSANGKLLLTGEYLVLHGALALALPTTLGQSMSMETTNDTLIQWDAYAPEGPWFSATLEPQTLEIQHTDDVSKANKLSSILKAVQSLNPDAFVPGLHFTTRLSFNPSWGLGSSSTLISNLARWAGVDPYLLLKNTLGGSGYDIACATANSPIFYRIELERPVSSPAYFAPQYDDHLFFVYLGKKQHSSTEVAGFNERWQHYDFQGDIETVSEISRSLPAVKTLNDFRNFIDIHEDILAHCLGREPVSTLFPDFEGSLKSLGAWGGDFILAATPWPFEKVKSFFHRYGLDVIFKYNELIANNITDNTIYGTSMDQRSL